MKKEKRKILECNIGDLSNGLNDYLLKISTGETNSSMNHFLPFVKVLVFFLVGVLVILIMWSI